MMESYLQLYNIEMDSNMNMNMNVNMNKNMNMNMNINILTHAKKQYHCEYAMNECLHFLLLQPDAGHSSESAAHSATIGNLGRIMPRFMSSTRHDRRIMYLGV